MTLGQVGAYDDPATGLKGVNLGNFLIKRVVNALAQDFENIKTFSI